MKLRTVGKLGVILSVILFCIGVGRINVKT